jgi:hypothetical protein
MGGRREAHRIHFAEEVRDIEWRAVTVCICINTSAYVSYVHYPCINTIALCIHQCQVLRSTQPQVENLGKNELYS